MKTHCSSQDLFYLKPPSMQENVTQTFKLHHSVFFNYYFRIENDFLGNHYHFRPFHGPQLLVLDVTIFCDVTSNPRCFINWGHEPWLSFLIELRKRSHAQSRPKGAAPLPPESHVVSLQLPRTCREFEEISGRWLQRRPHVCSNL